MTSVPDAISEMTQLQGLNLSNLPIKEFPSHQFFSNLTRLRSLVLKGCYSLRCLPPFPRLPELQCLDLSHLPIETFPIYADDCFYLRALRLLILRGCSKLGSLPSLNNFRKLEVLDLSHCTALEKIPDIDNLHHDTLQMLDLSYTSLPKISLVICSSLTHIFVRDTKELTLPKFFYKLTRMDLSGVQALNNLSRVKRLHYLIATDLSRTEVESIDFLSNSTSLSHLFLRDCTKLVNLSAIISLQKLEVLDISGCEALADLPEGLSNLTNIKDLKLSGCIGLRELREGLFDGMSCLEKLDVSKTNVSHLPSFGSLTNLLSLNLSHTLVQKLPDLSSLVNLKELLLKDCQSLIKTVPNLQRLANPDRSTPSLPRIQSGLGRISNLDEFHLVSTFLNVDSGFDRFRCEFTNIELLLSKMEENIIPITPDKTKEMSQSFVAKIANTRRDLKYILKSIDLLECSSNCTSCEELLLELMEATTCGLNDHYRLDYIDLAELIRVVSMLKLLVPRPKQEDGENDDEEKKEKKKKKKILHSTRYEPGGMVKFDSKPLRRDFLTSYDFLTDIQQKCLLYFTIIGSIVGAIKEKTLIQLWYGEGFIDPVLYADSIRQPQPTPNQKPDMSTYTSLAIHDATEASTTKAVENPSTSKEIGLQILKVLEQHKFISFREKDRFWSIYHEAYNLVLEKAKASLFFNFDDKSGRLTSYFKGSERACLLKSQAHCSPSCQLWLRYATSSSKQSSFENIRTLLRVSEPIIDLNPEWFSKMRNVVVLHLGSLNFRDKDEEHFDVMDLKFLEELKNMKQLRLVNLEGFSAIQKLPKSICMLENLRTLNLKYCCHLEELPVGIGSLKNLTHLDLSHCHLLSKLPKGLKLLSQLEELKGFVITYEDDGQQHSQACTLKDLMNLPKLRKLCIVVNRDRFPYSNDLHVFKEMKSLCNLMIAWKKDYENGREPNHVIRHGTQRHSRWKQLKCWEPKVRQSDIEAPLMSNRLHDLKKLVMCCFPLETAPNWLHPSELPKLEKLYIVAGHLKALPTGTNQNSWSIKTLRLNYLSLGMDEPKAKELFPELISFEKR